MPISLEITFPLALLIRHWRLRCLVEAGCGEFFKLRQMVAVVAGHGFEDGGEGHCAAFGMGDGLTGGVGWCVLKEREVPGAQSGEGGERLLRGDVGVGRGPAVLVEGLQDVVVFGEGLAQAKGEGDFAVGEMTEDLCRRPFAGSRSAVDALRAYGIGEGLKRGGGCGEDLRNPGEGSSGVEESGVGIGFWHRILLSFPLCHCRKLFGSHGVEGVVGEDEERVAVFAAKDEIGWPLGNFDGADEFGLRAVDEDLAGGEVDIALLVLRSVFSSALDK